MYLVAGYLADFSLQRNQMCVFVSQAEQLVQKKMEEIQNKVDLQQDVEGAYLTHLLLSEKMTVTEILGSITELLLAGVDTVSVQRRGGGALSSGPFNLRSPVSDLQHHLLGTLPAGPEPQHPRPVVPRSGECLPWEQVARQRRHRSDAVSEGRHQRDATVRRLPVSCYTREPMHACVFANCKQTAKYCDGQQKPPLILQTDFLFPAALPLA